MDISMFDIDEAYTYYKTHIYRIDRFRLLRERSLPIAGSVHPIDWELFGAILTDTRASEGYGADLEKYEVKSAVEGNSFEYQYHLRGGISKLEEDKRVDHIFISYSPAYSDVAVRLVEGTILAEKFESWRQDLINNYSGPNRKLRFRRNISYKTVVQQGAVVMRIEDGQLVYPIDPSTI